MLHLITCYRRIMPRLAELLLLKTIQIQQIINKNWNIYSSILCNNEDTFIACEEKLLSCLIKMNFRRVMKSFHCV